MRIQFTSSKLSRMQVRKPKLHSVRLLCDLLQRRRRALQTNNTGLLLLFAGYKTTFVDQLPQES